MLSGCHFPLTHSFKRKIVELGLKKFASEIHEVVPALKMIPVLAFEKQEEIEKSFEFIVSLIHNVTSQNHSDCYVIEKTRQTLFLFPIEIFQVLNRCWCE